MCGVLHISVKRAVGGVTTCSETLLKVKANEAWLANLI